MAFAFSPKGREIPVKKVLFVSALLLALLSCSKSLNASQAPGEAKAQAPDVQLKERAREFYQDILKNDRVAALELVASESKNQFLNTRFDGLQDFRITGIELAPAGDQATVRATRLTKAPGFTLPIEMSVVDTWKLQKGQWYFVLPPPGELVTPFGKMKFNSTSKPSDEAEVQEMKQRISNAYKNVDPDQYIQALQKFAGTTATDAKPSDKPAQPGAADLKSDNKQAKPSSAPPAQGDSSKPHE